MKKPVDPKKHGIIDYAFAGIQLFVPRFLGLDQNVKKAYQIMGLAFLGMISLTRTPVGLQKIISFKSHQKADAVFLAGLVLLTVSEMINKDKKALAFNLSFLSIAISHYLLTDYNSGK